MGADQYSQSAERWIKNVRSGRNLGHTHLEKPGLLSLVPDNLAGQSVLCLGVGSGEETEYYAMRRAERIVGVDNASKLIEVAKQTYPEREFKVMDIEHIKFPGDQFDLVVSSLALHYLSSWRQVLSEVARVLKPGGLFIFSTHHPAYWSAEKVNTPDGFMKVLGIRHQTKNKSITVYGDYLTPRNITNEIITGLKVGFYHRPLSELLNEIISSELELAQVLEPKPLPGAKSIDGNWFKKVSAWPPFIIFKLKKSGYESKQ